MTKLYKIVITDEIYLEAKNKQEAITIIKNDYNNNVNILTVEEIIEDR